MRIPIGTFENEEGEPIFLSKDDLMAHAHGIGSSRAGKSKFIEHIARHFIKSRQGFCLIDPAGFLFEDMVRWLAYVRPNGTNITLLDPSNQSRVVGFDPLHLLSTEKSEAAISARVDRMVALTLKALDMGDLSNAPRLARVMRCIYYVLIEQDLPIDAVRYFLFPRYFSTRDAIISRIQSETIRDQWMMLASKREEPYINFVDSTANRLLAFLMMPSITQMLAVPTNAIDIEGIVNNREVLLVNLKTTSDLFSKDCSRIIGTFLVDEIWSSIRKRTRDEARNLPKFFMIVDEFQSFATPDFPEMLDQSAKYGLHLMLFHQNYDQLSSQLKTSMTACRTRFVFGGVIPADATRMLAGSIPASWTLKQDIDAAPTLFRRNYLLKRPEQPLAYAYTPFVHEHRVLQPTIDGYVESISSKFLSPVEIDQYLQQKNRDIFDADLRNAEPPPPATDIGDALTSKVSLDPGKPEKPKKKRPSATYLHGRGGKSHREMQRVIERMAESYGFRSEIEKSVLDGTGSVDVSLERDGLKIACEVSITSSAGYEAKNVLKCLTAGYETVVVVVAKQNYISGLMSKLRSSIPGSAIDRVKVLSLAGCLGYLREISPAPEPSTSTKDKAKGGRLNFAEAAAFFGVSHSTLYRWVRAGKVPCYRPGHEFQFDLEDLRLIGRHELSGRRRAKVDLSPVKIEKPKAKTKKQQDDRYRKMLNMD